MKLTRRQTLKSVALAPLLGFLGWKVHQWKVASVQASMKGVPKYLKDSDVWFLNEDAKRWAEERGVIGAVVEPGHVAQVKELMEKKQWPEH